MSARPKLVLVDGFHTIFRAFFAIRDLANSKGEPTNAVFGFAQILRKVLKDEQPDLVGVAWDVSDATVRTEKFADYKANRAPMPDDLRPQIPYIRRLIEAMRIPILELENFEADDVMGTLAKRAAEAGYDVVLVSADKDLMQLVAPHVRLFHTGRGKLYDEALVTEDFGVPPSQVADVLALMGDTVDNVPGVPGIGDKGAKQLIKEYGSVEALLERAGELTRKAYREGLIEHRAQAILSKELVTIHTDLAIELEPERLRLDPPDSAALAALYNELEFHTLAAELAAQGAAAARADVAPAVECLTLGDLERALPIGPTTTSVAIVCDGPPLGVALAGESGEPFWVDLRRTHLAELFRVRLAGRLADPEAVFVGHDLKELLRMVAALPGVGVPRARLDDLMLFSYLTRATQASHGFEEVVAERLGERPRAAKDVGIAKGAAPAVGDASLLAFAGERIDSTRRLTEALRPELATGRLDEVYRRIEEPLMPVLVAMEEAGILLDREFLAALSGELAAELEVVERRIHESAGGPFNLLSPQQLGVVLFEKLQLPAGRKTKKTKNWSTDADTLEWLAGQGHEVPRLILRYREVAKLKSTYVDALPLMVAEDGRIHTRYHQAVAATGRLSSQNPNLQNIPIRTESGSRVRKAFHAAPGWRLVVADYSQIELRILAHIAQEQAMLQAFSDGEDIHRTTAASVLGVSPELVTADQRRAAKTINFGLIYGMQVFGLSQALGVTQKEAERFMEAYFARFSGVKRYMDETLKTAERDQRVETLFGRLRHLPEIASANWNLRENARRVAINARIQGTAADIQKLAMIAVDRRLREEKRAARLLLSVHDELVLEAPEAEVAAIAEAVRAEMEGVVRLDAPLAVEVGTGPTWFDAKA